MDLKNKITIILITSSIVCATFFAKCKRDNCTPQPTVINSLSTYDKSLIVYMGTDTIKFSTNTNDTLTLIGQGKNGFYNVVSGSGYGNCPGADYQYEGYTTKYNSLKTNDILTFTQTAIGTQGSDIDMVIYNKAISYNGKFNVGAIELTPPNKVFTFNNNTYADIKICYPQSNDKDSLYYSSKWGIVRIELTSGQLFNLVKN
ncbi:MAG: hypothetical protein ACHQK8_03035 [Bacteroidia bacterium]